MWLQGNVLADPPAVSVCAAPPLGPETGSGSWALLAGKTSAVKLRGKGPAA